MWEFVRPPTRERGRSAAADERASTLHDGGSFLNQYPLISVILST